MLLPGKTLIQSTTHPAHPSPCRLHNHQQQARATHCRYYPKVRTAASETSSAAVSAASNAPASEPASAPRSASVSASTSAEVFPTRTTKGLLVPSDPHSPPSQCDSLGMRQGPVVLQVTQPDGSKVWRMWFYSRSRDFDERYWDEIPTAKVIGYVGLLESSDGFTWEKVEGPEGGGAVLGPQADKPEAFDSAGVASVCVLLDPPMKLPEGCRYAMYYFGTDQSVKQRKKGPSTGLNFRPGLAVSPDGVSWQRVPGPYPSGALLETGAEGEFDAGFVGWPYVICVGPEDFRMYYHCFDTARKHLTPGVAVSKDGLTWEKRGPIEIVGCSPEEGDYDARGRGQLCVIKDPNGDGFIMFAEGAGHSIGILRSEDGFVWNREQSTPVLPIGKKNSWDTNIGTPHVVVQDDGSLNMYYHGREDTYQRGAIRRSQIGLAICDGKDLTQWRRWEG